VCPRLERIVLLSTRNPSQENTQRLLLSRQKVIVVLNLERNALGRSSVERRRRREDLGRLDRNRKKRMSNREWKNPRHGDARIAKMKDGRTHLAHKAEHAVDLDTGAVVTVTLQGADQGDTTTVDETLSQAGTAVAELVEREAELRPDDKPTVNVNGIEELVTDKGYHSGTVVQQLKSYEVRSYIPEKEQKGRCNWRAKPRNNRRYITSRLCSCLGGRAPSR
jgi:hypothetical protein